jgi:hypothetical protein
MNTVIEAVQHPLEGSHDFANSGLASSETNESPLARLAIFFWKSLCHIAEKPERHVPYY